MELDTIPLFFLFTTTILCALLVVAHSKRSLTSHVPPSPWRLPLVGNLHQLTGPVPHRSLASLAIVHGPVMLLHLGQVPAVIVSSARAAQEVLQTKDHLFATRPSLAIPKKLFYGCTDIAFAPHGPYWLQARKMGVLHLLTSKRVQAYRTVREEEVEALVQRVDQACDGGSSIVRLSELFAGYAKDVSGRIVFGATAAMRGEEWGAKVDVLLHEGNALLGRFNLGDCFPSLPWLGALDGTDAKVRKAFERIDQILEEIIDVAEKEMGVGEEVGQHDSGDGVKPVAVGAAG